MTGGTKNTTQSGARDEIAAAALTLPTLELNLSGVEQSRWAAHTHVAADYSWQKHTKTHLVHSVRNADGDNVLIANSGQVAQFVATMSPELALALAAWLEDEAVGAQTPTGEPTAHAVAVARTINAATRS